MVLMCFCFYWLPWQAYQTWWCKVTWRIIDRPCSNEVKVISASPKREIFIHNPSLFTANGVRLTVRGELRQMCTAKIVLS
jgi:hypothetical protein